MADDKSIIDQGADAAKDWVSKPENQAQLQTWGQWLWGKISSLWSSKK